MASESKKRKEPKFPVKGKDKFLTDRRSSKGAGGFNSSKRQNVKTQTKKEVEDSLKKEESLKYIDKFNSFKKLEEFIFQTGVEGLSSTNHLDFLDKFISNLTSIRNRINRDGSASDSDVSLIEALYDQFGEEI